MHAVEAYLNALWGIRGSGATVPETSAYGPLATLLDAAGTRLSPRVRCLIGLRQQGAGLPDAGFFTSDQFPRAGDATPRTGQLPSRGVMEVKSTRDDVVTIARSQQVAGYLARYGLVLVTNYRDFVLVDAAPDGAPRLLERYALAPSEADFWRSSPHELAEQHNDRLLEYLTRCLMHAAPLRAPRDVAFILASYARDARSRVEAQRDLPALAALRASLEQGLGITFEGERGDHFFRSTLVQTLFYGVFSAWVLWHADQPNRIDRFSWRLAGSFLHLPILQSLFNQLAQQSRLRALGLLEVLEWADSALNRIERATFFTAFAEDRAVQYFYEPFLEAFDPELRRELGVWYTPTEIVKYQVARIDQALRDELGIADGLADPRVYVLDPCCGTGAYLVEVVNTIAETLRARGDDDLLGSDLKRAVADRVFGFELLPAPFVVAHLQIGLLLQRYGAQLQEEERAAVYLTNALTGWEPPGPAQQRLLFPELEAERDAAARVKRDVPILVVIGNPPYNAFAGISPREEGGIVDLYKTGLVSTWGIRKFNLDDLYVRFLRIAERRIVEGTGQGIVCYISNASYLNDPSFVVLRQRLLAEFDALWFDDLHGDSRETGKLTPEGQPDPSVFSTEHNREGIRLGTAIGLMVRRSTRAPSPTVRVRDFWGISKRADLLASAAEPLRNAAYTEAQPSQNNRFSFRSVPASAAYLSWPKIVDLCAEAPISGLQEMRRGALMDMDADELAERMRHYFDAGTSWEALAALGTGLTQPAGGFNPQDARRRLLTTETFNTANIRRYALYPFDSRWCYYSAAQPLWNRARPALEAQAWPSNRFLITRMVAERPHEQIAVFTTPRLPDYHLLRPNAVAIPMRIKATAADSGQQSMFAADQAIQANLSAQARSYLATIGITNPDADAQTSELLWMHALAIGYAPTYTQEHGPAIRQDWPRIPLPTTSEALRASAALGQQVAVLLDEETPAAEVTAGTVTPALRDLGRLRRADGSQVQPQAGDLAITAGWGVAGRAGITMPGRGRITERDYTNAEQTAIGDGLTLLGARTLDIWLNDRACWRNVPIEVWEYTIGGYQVLKKWLSYRERSLLERDLTPDEARHFSQIVRRIAALLLIGPQLDANYRAAAASG